MAHHDVTKNQTDLYSKLLQQAPHEHNYNYGPGYFSGRETMNKISELNDLLIMNTCLRSLSIQMNPNDLSYDMFLILSKTEEANSEQVSVFFLDISSFQSNTIGGYLTQFMHLRVQECKSGWERVNFQLNELEDNKISFNFSSFEIF